MLVTGWVAVGLAVVLVAGTLVAYLKYRLIMDKVQQVNVTGLGKRPPKYDNALNILLIGSDSRSGKNGKIGGYVPGHRSDTVMVVHLSPGRSKLSVLSFPRDSVVPVLSCPHEPGFPGQNAQPGVMEQLNSTYANGGPGCLWHTLEQVTQIHIDDFIKLDFTGFISVINALGGVEVCLPYAIHPTSYDQLSLPAGPHVIKGYKALLFWRLREGIGLGSDLQRIQRDQLLMVSLVQKVLSSHLLNSPSKTYGIVKDIVDAHALTTDTGMTPSRLLSIATSMHGISRKSIQFVEVPTVDYPPNPNWVEFDSTQAPKLFAAVAHDVKLPKVTKKKNKKKTKTKTAPKLLSTSKVSVEVLNGSGVSGIAGATATALTTRGFHVLGAASATTTTGAPDFNYTTSMVEYSANADLAAARTVAAQLSKATLKQVSSVPAGTIDLILGSDFKTLDTQPSSESVGNLASKYSGYTGGTNICKNYGTAFVGPDG